MGAESTPGYELLYDVTWHHSSIRKLKSFHDEVAHGMEQREEVPEFKGSGN